MHGLSSSSSRASPLLFTALIATLASHVAAHGFVSNIVGANKVVGQGFAVKDAKSFTDNQVSVLKQATGCGSINGKNVDIAAETAITVAAGVPSFVAGSNVAANWAQINAGADGAGPGTAFIDTTATGNSFKPLTFVKNFADGGANSDNAFTLAIPAGTKCTGAGSVCLMRVQNSAGPFGSCFVMTDGSGGAAAAAPNGGASNAALQGGGVVGAVTGGSNADGGKAVAGNNGAAAGSAAAPPAASLDAAAAADTTTAAAAAAQTASAAQQGAGRKGHRKHAKAQQGKAGRGRGRGRRSEKARLQGDDE